MSRSKLIEPSEELSHTIFSRTGADPPNSADGSQANLNGLYGFSDTAPASPTWWETDIAVGNADITQGSYRASTIGGGGTGGVNTLITPTFAGLSDLNGKWTLRFRDRHPSDSGVVSGAALSITTPARPTPMGMARRTAPTPMTTTSGSWTPTGSRVGLIRWTTATYLTTSMTTAYRLRRLRR